MRRLFLLLLGLGLLTLSVEALKAQEQILPAGTLLNCTLDEPNFSSHTAEVGDPILCHLGATGLFGSPVFPRGAYLGGRFEDYRDPGHFFGKGWLQLTFDRLVTPSGVLPIAAKIVSASRLRVNPEGRIRGTGHPRRDAAEWLFPPLWPVKTVTLPRRGPRPRLKGESRLVLRLLDDVELPSPVARVTVSSVPARPALSRHVEAYNSYPSHPRYDGPSVPSGGLQSSLATALLRRPAIADEQVPSQLTVLVAKDGSAWIVRDYWVELGALHYVMTNGESGLLPLGRLNLDTTVALNHERGVEFVLRSKTDRSTSLGR